jgi:hypothetical protein
MSHFCISISLPWLLLREGPGRRLPVAISVNQRTMNLLRGFILGASLSLYGCATVDRFSSRAVDYNHEVETVQKTGLLLNVMRAAYRQPLQFIDVTTITGLASAQGGATAGLPLGGVRGTGAELFTLAPVISFSGGPSFTIAVLNTQDFYKGILTPITPQLVDWYIQAGFPPVLIFTLFLNEIDFNAQQLPAARNDFETNESGTDLEYNDFARKLRSLVQLGLSTEAVKKVETIGPRLSYNDVRKLKVYKDLDAQELKLVPHRICDTDSDTPGIEPCDATLTTEEKAQLRGDKYYYQLQKSTTSYRFCFVRSSKPVIDPDWLNPSPLAPTKNATLKVNQTDIIAEESICGAKESSDITQRKVSTLATRDPEYKTRRPAISSTKADSIKLWLLNADSPPKPEPVSFQLKLRSTEQIIYYLGQIARYELKMGYDTGHWVTAISPCQELELQLTASAESCVKLFTVTKDRTSPAISFSYLDHEYSVPISSSGKDRSGQLLEIATQILNLNKAGKDFPAPTIIPVLQ